MNIIGELENDWQRAASHLHHHAATIAVNDQPALPEGETPVSLSSLVESGITKVENVEAQFRSFLDDEAPQIRQVAGLIGTSKIFTSAEAALGIPGLAPVLDGIADVIDKLVAAHPQAAAAPEAPAEPVADPA